MQKISIKELVDFRRKANDRVKRNFAIKLKSREPKAKLISDDDTTGGDYWVTSTSCIYNVFKHNKIGLYEDKLDVLANKFEAAKDKRVKSMYQRNMDILISFKDFSFSDIRPLKILKFETVQKVHKIFNIDGFPLYVTPSLIFSHDRHGKSELGAIWLIPRLHGFKKSELGMFCEVLHKFLIKNYSDRYQISDDLCVAIDTFSAQKVAYQELIDEKIPFLIDRTLNEIKELR